MTKVQMFFEITAKKVVDPYLNLNKDRLGDYWDVKTEALWMLFSLAYRQGERDSTKPPHELEETK